MSEAIDAVWYKEYQALRPEKSVDVVLRSVANIAVQRAHFVNENFEVNPDLTPTVDIAAVDNREEATLRFQDRLGSSEAEQVVKDAYMPLIDGKLNGFRLQRAVVDKDVDSFIEAITETYGTPNPLIFRLLLQHCRELAKRQSLDPVNANVRAEARRVLDLLPELPIPSLQVWPTDRLFQDVQQMHAEIFETMYEGIELPPEISGSEAVRHIRTIVKNLGYDFGVVPQDEGMGTIAVNNKHKVIKVPRDEVYTRQRLRGLLVHEIGIHVAEHENGKNQPLKILSLGLRGSIRAGEGKGVMAEQVAYDSLKDFMATRRFFDIARRHISIGLARGLDGQERDFKEVFRAIHALDRMWEFAEAPNDPLAASERAIEKSWELLTKRTLKGMTARGFAYFKDKIYAEGNVAMWHLLGRHPEVFPHLNLGKYDLTNASHVKILKTIGAVPKELLGVDPRAI